MRFRLTSHAEEELARRTIPRDALESVLSSPQQVVPADRGRKAYQSQLDLGDGRIFLVRAIVDEADDPATVVTVYRTHKIAKYWRSP
ncbi:MAG: DUF4258 domain-containing protein [Candidatus Methylomirabilis sp.]|nr:DUF4258 domain-containing protein [Deltaproteobacteria bacterium]